VIRGAANGGAEPNESRGVNQASTARARQATLVALLALVVVLTAAAPAQAHWTFPGQRATHEPELHAMLAVADKFWTDRGVLSPCTHTALDVADALPGGARGHGQSPIVNGRDLRPWLPRLDCRVTLDSYTAGRELAFLRNHRKPAQRRREVAMELCTTMVHEVGHTRGLHHTPTGVMNHLGPEIPGDCRAFARQMVPSCALRRAASGRARRGTASRRPVSRSGSRRARTRRLPAGRSQS
jgi:hypothetical protein